MLQDILEEVKRVIESAEPGSTILFSCGINLMELTPEGSKVFYEFITESAKVNSVVEQMRKMVEEERRKNGLDIDT